MATSGLYAYAPEVADFLDEAWERAEIDPATVVVRHIRSARRSMNLLFSEWAAKGINIFATDEQTQTVTDGTASYSVASGTLIILDMVVRRSGIDTPVTVMTMAEYHAIPDKTSEGLPSRFYHNRADGTYKLWNVPENSTDQIRYWRLRRLQDVLTSAETPDVTYWQNEALASGLAAKLALKFNKAKFAELKALADVAFLEAKRFGRERGITSVSMGYD